MNDTPRQQPLAFADLTIRHANIVAVRGVSFAVQPGERVALIGPSGAGKSSLLHSAAGFVEPTSGEVWVLGSRMGDLTKGALRKHRMRVGIIAQDLALTPGLRVVHSVNGGRLGSWSTPRAITSLVRAHGRQDVERVLSAVGLADRADARTGDLSGGEQQRVAIARTLLQSPDLVLADEPTSSVDPKLADHAMGLLCDRAAPWTTVVSVHDPDLALRHVDRIIGLSHGSVVFDRSVDDVEPTDITGLYETSVTDTP